MGINKAPEQCYITDFKTNNVPTSKDCIDYTIQVNNKEVHLQFEGDHTNNQYIEANKHILTGLILNSKFPTKYTHGEVEPLNNQELEFIINESIVPRTPSEKLNNLLLYLHSLQKYEGADIDFPKGLSGNKLANIL